MHTLPVHRQCLHARRGLIGSRVPTKAANRNTGVRNYKIVRQVLALEAVNDTQSRNLFTYEASEIGNEPQGVEYVMEITCCRV
jgi:hypothetical protein